MPGLALTMDQARRLWGCDARTCRCVMDVLVARQFFQRYLREHWDVRRHAQIRDPAVGVLALIEKWGVDAQDSPERGTQQWKRGRVRGRTLRGEDASPRRTV